MATTSVTLRESPALAALLARADDALVLGHRLSEWCGRAPMLEEEMALANIALDLIGQARGLYQHAAALEDAGHDEDHLAYLRDARQFRNLLLLELPNGDFARTILRLLLYASFAERFWNAVHTADPTLAGIAAMAAKECAYHARHAADWTIRLGDGTAESHARAAAALDLLWPYTGELFAGDPAEAALFGVDAAALREAWRVAVLGVLREATLPLPVDGWMQRGGRDGRHTEHLGHMLAEMQSLPHTLPGAVW
jgi:ring-1,2-phenylacetyl-CoA epoxidase subunit PaaC